MSTPVTFDLEKRSHFYNTFDAHRLLLWGLQQGRQIELKKALLRELAAFYRARGINAVPAMVLNGRQLVSGSQSVSAYEQLLREISAVAA